MRDPAHHAHRGLCKGCECGKTDTVLLGFSKAFDKVNHSKLLWKLHQYGIRGHVLDWVEQITTGSN